MSTEKAKALEKTVAAAVAVIAVLIVIVAADS
jgi:hypothetical protein